MNGFKDKSIRRFFWLALLIFVLVPMPSAWIADILKDWWLDDESIGGRETVMLVVATAALLAAAWIIARVGRELQQARVIEESHGIRPRKAVLAMLSPCTQLKRENDAWHVYSKETGEWVSTVDYTLPALVAKTAGLPQWSWQQTLRAAHCHHETLEKLILIGSSDKEGGKGSGAPEQIDLAKQYFETYFPKTEILVPGPHGLQKAGAGEIRTADFEKVDSLLRLLRDVIRQLHNERTAYQDTDIAIDCTGGSKVASIAAAMVTLDHPDLVFQYTSNSGDVVSFNVVSERNANIS